MKITHIVAIALTAFAAAAQPNPYRTVEHWAKMPEGRTWGSTSGVQVARDGHIWVAERCGANSCAGSPLPSILEFDMSGKLLKSFGANLFIFPHGLTLDADGNLWVTDGQGRDGKGHQAIKFNPNEIRNYLYRGYIYELQKDKKNAMADTESALKIDPTNQSALDRKARLQVQVGFEPQVPFTPRPKTETTQPPGGSP